MLMMNGMTKNEREKENGWSNEYELMNPFFSGSFHGGFPL